MIPEIVSTILPEVLTASSGEICSCNGEWEVIGSPSTTAVLSKGKVARVLREEGGLDAGEEWVIASAVVN